LDYYKNFESLQSAFSISPHAFRFTAWPSSVANAAPEQAIHTFGKHWISYGTGKDNDYVLAPRW